MLELDHGDQCNSAGNTPSGEIKSSCPTAGAGLGPRAGTAVQYYCKEFLCGDQDAILLMSCYCPMFFHPVCAVEKTNILKASFKKGKIINVLFNISPLIKSNLNFQSSTLAESLAAYYSLHLFIWLSHCITNILTHYLERILGDLEDKTPKLYKIMFPSVCSVAPYFTLIPFCYQRC